MMRKTCLRGGALTLGTVLLSALTAQEALAQAATITGRVTNEAGAAIVGANVFIQSLNIAAQSGANGQYTLTVPETQASGQRVQLSARFIGFAPITREVTLTPGPQTQNFSLKADPFRLEEMIVTGVAEATSARKLTFSVARVSEEQLREVPASSPVAALAGKVSGARIATGVGVPGSSPTIRLRGSTNLTVGGSQPLIIVDGVITTNSISDIDANDIESIEVLKGAAAASFYGSNAANGVVNITTKRGRNIADGETSFLVRSEYGTQGLERWVPLNQHHHYKMNEDGTIATNAAGTTRVPDPDGIADNPFPTTGPNRWRNQLQEWLQDGDAWSTTAQLGLRRGSTNVHTTFTTGRNQGVLPFTRGQDRQNFRLNVDQGISDQLDFSASVTYGVQKRDQTSSSQSWFELLQAAPDIDLRHPFGEDAGLPEYFPDLPNLQSTNSRSNPLYPLFASNLDNRRERILGSGTVRWRPLDWLRVEGSYGTDRLNERQQSYNYRGYLNNGGNPTEGSMGLNSDNNIATNQQLNATASRQFGDVFSTTRVAYIVETERLRSFSASGTEFQVGQVVDLDALNPEFYSIGSGEQDIRAVNYAVSQAFDIKDRYIVDLLYRRDGSSLFGPDERWQNFYRVSGAWIISEDFQIPGVQSLKLRAARGTAGLRPSYSAQYETYNLNDGSISKQNLGNRQLKPAIQTEDEYGINVQFLDRFDLEVVRAERVTEGAFLNVPLVLATSGGFANQWQNAADVGAKTTEVALQVRVFDTPDFSYNFSLTGDHTSQRILRMDRAPFRIGGDNAQGQNVFYYKSGESLGIIYGTQWVRDPQQLLDNPANANINLNDYTVNPLGYVVKTSAPNAPIAYVDAAGNNQFKIGDVNPDFSFGWANNIRYKGIGLYALIDGVRGGDIYNFSKQWMFQDYRHGEIDQSGVPEDRKVQAAFFATGLYNALNANSYFVEDGSYARLRELSLSYSFSPNLLNRIGAGRLAEGVRFALIGRNLLTWSDYSGFDPEVTSGNDFNFRIDGFKYPNFRSITGSIELSF
jgi:TonB-linked SusC/RagA family outer membrane protein